MRDQAVAHEGFPPVSYRGGDAEHLPVVDEGARGVVAATAAH